jgi:cytochrome c553
MTSRLFLFISLPFLLASGSVWADSSARNPHIQILSVTCATCHGTNGNSVGTIPALAGMDKKYFIKRMQAFKAGEATATVMDKHAKGLTAEEINQLAAYFAIQPIQPAALPPHPSSKQ